MALLLKENRYDPASKQLTFLDAEKASFERQIRVWADFFAAADDQYGGLPSKYIQAPEEIRQLTAFFAWTAWASVANRPDKPYSYTNNFPYDPPVGNRLTRDAILWSALSVVMLLGGLALVLFTFGRFDYLGWKGGPRRVQPLMRPGEATAGQKAVVKYFVIVALLFLAQVVIGGAPGPLPGRARRFLRHRSGPVSAQQHPAHLAPAAGPVLDRHRLCGRWPAAGLLPGQARTPRPGGGRPPALLGPGRAGGGQPAGEIAGHPPAVRFPVDLVRPPGLGISRTGALLAGDSGRGPQLLAVAALPGHRTGAARIPSKKEIDWLFLGAAASIPLFYLPAFFFGSTTNFAVVDTWRFWIIHLWVEGFFELFVTVLVAVTFYQLGIVRRINVLRVIYMDAILFLAGGIIGTAHHWYWTGQTNFTMALAAMFSALEVVPLTLLDPGRLGLHQADRDQGADAVHRERSIPHKWAFYFLMAVGFWNFVGAGVFGFLINMPVVSYFEVGTVLTLNHGHAALLGAFGMLAMALLVLCLRHVLSGRSVGAARKVGQGFVLGLERGPCS